MCLHVASRHGESRTQEFELVRSPTIEGILLGRTLVGGNNSAVKPFNLAWTLEVRNRMWAVGQLRCC